MLSYLAIALVAISVSHLISAGFPEHVRFFPSNYRLKTLQLPCYFILDHNTLKTLHILQKSGGSPLFEVAGLFQFYAPG